MSLEALYLSFRDSRVENSLHRKKNLKQGTWQPAAFCDSNPWIRFDEILCQ